MSRYQKERENVQIMAGNYCIDLYVVQRWELIPDIRVDIEAESEHLVGLFSTLDLANNAIWEDYFSLARRYQKEDEPPEDVDDYYYFVGLIAYRREYSEVGRLRWSVTTLPVDVVHTD